KYTNQLKYTHNGEADLDNTLKKYYNTTDNTNKYKEYADLLTKEAIDKLIELHDDATKYADTIIKKGAVDTQEIKESWRLFMKKIQVYKFHTGLELFDMFKETGFGELNDLYKGLVSNSSDTSKLQALKDEASDTKQS